MKASKKRLILKKIADTANSWKIAKSLGSAIGYFIRVFDRLDDNERNLELLAAFVLRQRYESIAKKQSYRSEINKYEVKCYSQNGEDGVLLYVFSTVGVTNRCFVEFGVGDGRECNTANLVLNFGWNGVLIDSDERNVSAARYYYQKMLGPESANIKVVQCLVTMENINKVLLDSGINGEIDLLSIDIDGNDYWVWKAITAIDPRVVVIEYNASLGFEKSITVKYNSNFDRFEAHPSGFYHGASLAALTKLANYKGYVLAGCESNGVNAFFVRKDVAREKLTEVPVQKAYFPDFRRLKTLSTFQQFECIKRLDFDYV